MVLDNKLQLTSQVELNRAEEKLGKQKARQLFESGDINAAEVGSFAGLAYIHTYLFGDVYAFAGQVRDVNLAKGNFRFAPVMYLQQSLAHISAMPQQNFDQRRKQQEALQADQHDDAELKALENTLKKRPKP